MTRRESFVAHTVVYAAVGASDSPDLMRFPPEGATPFVEELRLGSGSDRFLLASSALMTWGAQRGHGIDVVEVTPGDGGHYAGISFDAAGLPQPAAPEDLQFSPDGVQYLRAGSVVRLQWPDARAPQQFRVVYTVDGQREVGFALGSADTEGVAGEVRYAVEHREDDSVWATARGFLFASQAGLLGLKGRNEARAVIAEVRQQITALAPGALLVQGDAGPRDGEAGAAEAAEVADSEVVSESAEQLDIEISIVETADETADHMAEAPASPTDVP